MHALRWITATLGLCLPAAAFAQAPPPQQPEEPRIVGVRLEGGFTFTTGLGVFIPASNDTGSAVPTLQGSEGNLRIGWDAPMGITGLLGIGYGSSSVSSTTTPSTGTAFTQSNSISELVLSLQGRYYFRPHKGLSPYGFVELQKSFVGGHVTDTQVGSDVAATQKALDQALERASHFGALGGAGAEYLFAPGFGIGGQWGIGAFFQSTDQNDPSPGIKQTQSSWTQVATVAQLYACFRL